MSKMSIDYQLKDNNDLSQKALVVGYRPDIQGLRAVAVLCVVFSHASIRGFSGGFVGVDLFFVLSGYLITSMLYSEYSNFGKINLVDFYSRRLKRLLPALLVVFLGTLAVAFAVIGDSVENQISSAAYVTIWLSNLFFTFHETGYFDELAMKDLFLHTWSLGVEEQFYLIWPFLVVVLGRMSAYGLTTIAGTVFRNRLIVGFSIFVMVCFALSLFWSFRSPLFAYYQMPSRAWQFGIGALTFLMVGHFAIKPDSNEFNVTGCVFLLGGGIAIATGVVFFNEHMMYPGWAALLPSLGAVSIIVAGHFLPMNRNALALKPLIWIGDRSYSIYLWHWPCMIILQFFLVGHQDKLLLLLIGLTLLLADLTYRFIERPFWKGAFSKFSAHKVIIFGLLSMFVGSSIGLHSQIKAVQKPHTSDESVVADFFDQWRIDMPEIYSLSCDSWYYSAEVMPCVFGDEGANKTVVLLGDSIGAQWFSLISKAFDSRDWRLVVFTKSSCPMVDEPYFYTRIKERYVVCEEWRENVLLEMKSWRPNLVFVGSVATAGFSDEEWVSGSRRIWKKLLEAGAKVVAIPGTPALGISGPQCIMRQIQQGKKDLLNECQSDQTGAVQFKVAELLRGAAQGMDNVEVLNLNEFVCPSGICRAISNDGIAVFRDDQHLTDTFVKSIYPKVQERLRSFAN